MTTPDAPTLDVTDKLSLARFRKTPTGFAKDVLGVEPRLHQARILQSVRDNRRTMVVTCNSVGKDYIAGAAVLWWLSVWEEALAITTAITGDQVRLIQWTEIRSLFRKAKYRLGGEIADVEPWVRFGDKRNGFGLSTRDEPERLQGLHRSHILVVITEASAVPVGVFDGLRTLGASQDLHVLALANPTRNSGEVYNACHAQAEGWNVIQYGAFDLPNLKACQALGAEHMEDYSVIDHPELCPTPYPYLINHTFERETSRDFGVDSDWYKVHVLGQFGDSESNALIPLSWIEAAIERKVVTSQRRYGGLDVARQGRDRTAYAEISGNAAYRLEEWPRQELEDTYAQLTGAILGAGQKAPDLVAIDDTGLGGNIAPRAARDKRYAARTLGVDFAGVADEKGRFVNKVSEMWWRLRQRLDPNSDRPLALSAARFNLEIRRRITAQLSTPTYDTNDASGRIRVNKKGDGTESPDLGDGLILAIEAENRKSRRAVQ